MYFTFQLFTQARKKIKLKTEFSLDKLIQILKYTDEV